MFLEALQAISASQRDAAGHTFGENEFVKDGLKHCAVCGEPIQRVISVPEAVRSIVGSDEIIPWCMCKCQRDVAQKELERKEQLELEDNIRRIRGASLMDLRLHDARFEKCAVDASNKKAITLCRNYVKTFEQWEEGNQGLIFFGPAGTGKTFAAACIANELIERRIFVMMTSFVQLMRIAYEGGEEWFCTIANLKKARLLIIDDLGAERLTDTAQEHVYGIVDDRYRSNKPVIFTTNFSLDSMKSATDQRLVRVYDRILETCYPVQFTGASWRKDEAAKRFERMKALEEGA